MAMMTPEPMPMTNAAVSVRAPPPSPVAPGRRSPFANDDVLTEYLEQSLRVPDLILPDRVFPKQKSAGNPPKLDLEDLNSDICDLIARTGCVEVVNHGISRDLIRLVLFLAGGVFEISPEKKAAATRSPERRYGFDEVRGEDEGGDEGEEFLWCGDEAMRLEMEGVWPFGYSNFSQEMEKLHDQIEQLGIKILQFLEHHSAMKFRSENNNNYLPEDHQELAGKLCCLQKHRGKTGGESSVNSQLRYDVIRMVIRGSEFPHALCLHICSGSTDFHVYSKRGWVSFSPHENSIVITVGDKLQVWSDGQYKHVIGRPVFKDEREKCISMSFLFSPPNLKNSNKDDNFVTISLNHQIIFAILVSLIYQFLIYTHHLFYKILK